MPRKDQQAAQQEAGGRLAGPLSAPAGGTGAGSSARADGERSSRKGNNALSQNFSRLTVDQTREFNASRDNSITSSNLATSGAASGTQSATIDEATVNALKLENSYITKGVFHIIPKGFAGSGIFVRDLEEAAVQLHLSLTELGVSFVETNASQANRGYASTPVASGKVSPRLRREGELGLDAKGTTLAVAVTSAVPGVTGAGANQPQHLHNVNPPIPAGSQQAGQPPVAGQQPGTVGAAVAKPTTAKNALATSAAVTSAGGNAPEPTVTTTTVNVAGGKSGKTIAAAGVAAAGKQTAAAAAANAAALTKDDLAATSTGGSYLPAVTALSVGPVESSMRGWLNATQSGNADLMMTTDGVDGLVSSEKQLVVPYKLLHVAAATNENDEAKPDNLTTDAVDTADVNNNSTEKVQFCLTFDLDDAGVRKGKQHIVQEIFVSNCLLDAVIVPGGFYRAFLTALFFCERLKRLTLNDCGLLSIHVKLLATCLPNLTQLRYLSLDHNRMTSVGITALCMQETNVTILSLAHCAINDSIMHSMANALLAHGQVCWRPERKGLISLNLAGNGFGDIGLQHLATFLRFNRSVIRLNLSQNDISDTGVETLGRQVLLKFPLSHREIVSMRMKRVKWLQDMLHGGSEQSGSPAGGKPPKRHPQQPSQRTRRIAVRLGKRTDNRNTGRRPTNGGINVTDGGGVGEGVGRPTITMNNVREEPSKLVTNAAAKKGGGLTGSGNIVLGVSRTAGDGTTTSGATLSAGGATNAQQTTLTAGGNLVSSGSVAGGKGKTAAGSGKNAVAAGAIAAAGGGGAAGSNAGVGIGGKSLVGSDEMSANQQGDPSGNAAATKSRDFYTVLRQKMYDMLTSQQQQQQQQSMFNAAGGGIGSGVTTAVGGDGQLMLDDYFDPLVHGNMQRMPDGSVWFTGNRVLSYLNLQGNKISDRGVDLLLSIVRQQRRQYVSDKEHTKPTQLQNEATAAAIAAGKNADNSKTGAAGGNLSDTSALSPNETTASGRTGTAASGSNSTTTPTSSKLSSKSDKHSKAGKTANDGNSSTTASAVTNPPTASGQAQSATPAATVSNIAKGHQQISNAGTGNTTPTTPTGSRAAKSGANSTANSSTLASSPGGKLKGAAAAAAAAAADSASGKEQSLMVGGGSGSNAGDDDADLNKPPVTKQMRRVLLMYIPKANNIPLRDMDETNYRYFCSSARQHSQAVFAQRFRLLMANLMIAFDDRRAELEQQVVKTRAVLSHATATIASTKKRVTSIVSNNVEAASQAREAYTAACSAQERFQRVYNERVRRLLRCAVRIMKRNYIQQQREFVALTAAHQCAAFHARRNGRVQLQQFVYRLLATRHNYLSPMLPHAEFVEQNRHFRDQLYTLGFRERLPLAISHDSPTMRAYKWRDALNKLGTVNHSAKNGSGDAIIQSNNGPAVFRRLVDKSATNEKFAWLSNSAGCLAVEPQDLSQIMQRYFQARQYFASLKNFAELFDSHVSVAVQYQQHMVAQNEAQAAALATATAVASTNIKPSTKAEHFDGSFRSSQPSITGNLPASQKTSNSATGGAVTAAVTKARQQSAKSTNSTTAVSTRAVKTSNSTAGAAVPKTTKQQLSQKNREGGVNAYDHAQIDNMIKTPTANVMFADMMGEHQKAGPAKAMLRITQDMEKLCEDVVKFLADPSADLGRNLRAPSTQRNQTWTTKPELCRKVPVSAVRKRFECAKLLQIKQISGKANPELTSSNEKFEPAFQRSNFRNFQHQLKRKLRGGALTTQSATITKILNAINAAQQATLAANAALDESETDVTATTEIANNKITSPVNVDGVATMTHLSQPPGLPARRATVTTTAAKADDEVKTTEPPALPPTDDTNIEAQLKLLEDCGILDAQCNEFDIFDSSLESNGGSSHTCELILPAQQTPPLLDHAASSSQQQLQQKPPALMNDALRLLHRIKDKLVKSSLAQDLTPPSGRLPATKLPDEVEEVGEARYLDRVTLQSRKAPLCAATLTEWQEEPEIMDDNSELEFDVPSDISSTGSEFVDDHLGTAIGTANKPKKKLRKKFVTKKDKRAGGVLIAAGLKQQPQKLGVTEPVPTSPHAQQNLPLTAVTARRADQRASVAADQPLAQQLGKQLGKKSAAVIPANATAVLATAATPAAVNTSAQVTLPPAQQPNAVPGKLQPTTLERLPLMRTGTAAGARREASSVRDDNAPATGAVDLTLPQQQLGAVGGGLLVAGDAAGAGGDNVNSTANEAKRKQQFLESCAQFRKLCMRWELLSKINFYTTRQLTQTARREQMRPRLDHQSYTLRKLLQRISRARMPMWLWQSAQGHVQIRSHQMRYNQWIRTCMAKLRASTGGGPRRDKDFAQQFEKMLQSRNKIASHKHIAFNSSQRTKSFRSSINKTHYNQVFSNFALQRTKPTCENGEGLRKLFNFSKVTKLRQNRQITAANIAHLTNALEEEAKPKSSRNNQPELTGQVGRAQHNHVRESVDAVQQAVAAAAITPTSHRLSTLARFERQNFVRGRLRAYRVRTKRRMQRLHNFLQRQFVGLNFVKTMQPVEVNKSGLRLLQKRTLLKRYTNMQMLYKTVLAHTFLLHEQTERLRVSFTERLARALNERLNPSLPHNVDEPESALPNEKKTRNRRRNLSKTDGELKHAPMIDSEQHFWQPNLEFAARHQAQTVEKQKLLVERVRATKLYEAHHLRAHIALRGSAATVDEDSPRATTDDYYQRQRELPRGTKQEQESDIENYDDDRRSTSRNTRLASSVTRTGNSPTNDSVAVPGSETTAKRPAGGSHRLSTIQPDGGAHLHPATKAEHEIAEPTATLAVVPTTATSHGGGRGKKSEQQQYNVNGEHRPTRTSEQPVAQHSVQAHGSFSTKQQLQTSTVDNNKPHTLEQLDALTLSTDVNAKPLVMQGLVFQQSISSSSKTDQPYFVRKSKHSDPSLAAPGLLQVNLRSNEGIDCERKNYIRLVRYLSVRETVVERIKPNAINNGGMGSENGNGDDQPSGASTKPSTAGAGAASTGAGSASTAVSGNLDKQVSGAAAGGGTSAASGAAASGEKRGGSRKNK